MAELLGKRDEPLNLSLRNLVDLARVEPLLETPHESDDGGAVSASRASVSASAGPYPIEANTSLGLA